jgi:hypothetical protein
MPEMFVNLNKVRVANELITMEFPKWSGTAHQFVEFHRYALEWPPTRLLLNKWVDLVFGYKQQGAEAAKALNLYHPFGYRGLHFPEEDERIRPAWIQSCGQLPQQIFEWPAPNFASTGQPGDLRFRLNEASDIYRFDRLKGVVVCAGEHFDAEFLSVVDIGLSRRGFYLAVTFSVSRVTIFRVRQAKLTVHLNLFRRATKFSAVNDYQYVCVTVCEAEVVIWSIFSGSIVNIIDELGVNSVVCDDDLNMFYYAVADAVVQNSINGERLRRLELGGKRITALGLIGIDFTFDHRIVLVGCEDGTVVEVATCFLSGQLSVRREVNVSEYRIARLIARHGTNVVDVLDGIGMMSICK